MILHRDGSRRDVGEVPTSVPELARSLRRERTRQGLRPEDVAGRTGVPLHQVEALESGTVDRLTDGVNCVRSLRRYADFLGLPGDRYALALVELWPASPSVPPPTPAYAAGAMATGATGATAAVAGPATVAPPAQLEGAGPGVVTGSPTAAVAVTAAGTTLYRPADDDTGAVARVGAPDVSTAPPAAAALPAARYVGGSGPGPPGTSPFISPVPIPLVDTGVTPAVPRASGRRSRARVGPGIIFLRLLIAVVILLLIAAVAGLAVNHWRPQWLRSLHLPHSAITASPTTATSPATTSPGGSAPAGSGTTGSTSTTAAGKGSTKAHAAPVYTATKTTATGVTGTVRASAFTVKVVTVGGPSWVQVSDGQHPAPVFSEVVPAGQTETFANQQTLTVQVGSTAGRIFVFVQSKVVAFYFPTAAPFTLSLTSS